MTLDEGRLLVDYHYWARDRLVTAMQSLSAEEFLRDMGNSFKSVRDTAVHIYAAEAFWYARWQGGSPASLVPPDKFPSLDPLVAAWSEHEALVREFVDGLGEDGMNRALEYGSPSGKSQSTVFAHMLQHVVNHASYHRGQVTTMLRQLGEAPPKSMDLMAFYRERRA
jgi:uncharacterized damage-inducible protein DinB